MVARLLSGSMRIISWNIRGLGSRMRRGTVKDFLHHESPNIVIFSGNKERGV